MSKRSIEHVERRRPSVQARAVALQNREPRAFVVSLEARYVAEFWRDALGMPTDEFPMFQRSLRFDPLND